jgi:hypothetical protein
MMESISALVTSSEMGCTSAEAPTSLHGASRCRTPQHDQWLLCDNVRGQQAARKQRKVFGCPHMPAKYRRREHIEVPQFEMEWNNDKK